MSKRALITGITGQDGSYLAELLLAKGYEVHGIIRRSSSLNTGRIDHLFEHLRLHYGDMLDGARLRQLVGDIYFDEIYNLAAQSHVRVSFDEPEYTTDVNANGTLRLLEAVRQTGLVTRIYQAGSSEMFGAAPPPQTLTSAFHPRSPYGVSKVAAHHHAVNYRESYGMFVANGILFNHESPRRGETFVTRKVTRAATRIKLGLQDKLYLGNLDAYRDWGFAKDYVDAMWRMLQQDEPGDFVIATGTAYTVREFVEMAFKYVGLDYKEYVVFDPRFRRPAEVDHLCGRSDSARRALGWEPKTSFGALVAMMMRFDLELAWKEKKLKDG